MKKDSTINERFFELVNTQADGNQKKFAEIVGVSPQVISNILIGRKNAPGFKLLSSVASKFEDINAFWILTGKGEKLKKDDTEIRIKTLNEEINLLKKSLSDKDKIISLQDDKIKTLENTLSELKKDTDKKCVDQDLSSFSFELKNTNS